MTPDLDQARLARIALAHMVEPGDREIGEVVCDVGPVEALRRLRAGLLSGRVCAAAAARLGAHEPYALAVDAVRLAGRLGSRILTPEDADWPRRLADLRDISVDGPDSIDRDTYPPQAVWIRGPWSLTEACERSVAVVGSRAATPYGTHVAGDFGHGLAGRAWTVVSGGAYGIDAAAHRGALAGDGCTVAVLASGIDRPYPVGHVSLFDRIAERGLLLSEWPPGSDPHRRRFLVRNRVIAALTLGTLVVEAGLRSGARFTVGRARRLNRLTLAVPGPVTSAMSLGCHEELRGGSTILAASVEHVVDAVGRIGADMAHPQSANATARDQLTSMQAQVLDGVRPRKVLTAEQIAAAAGVSVRDARRTLPGLEESGFVVAAGGGYRLPQAIKSTTAAQDDRR